VRETHTAPFSQMETSGPPLSGWPVKALAEGEKPQAPSDEPGDGVKDGGYRRVASSGV
jgi:hypothetical protein